MMKCAACNKTLPPAETRTVLCDEIQQIIWGPADAEPEVEIAGALWLASYCSAACADAGLSSHLSMVDAAASYDDVRPMQSCSICKKPFDTSRRHHTMVMSKESGEEDAPESNDDETLYPARFCPSCMPVNKDFGRYRPD